MIRIHPRLPQYLTAGALLLLAGQEPVAGAARKMFVTSASGRGNLGDWPEAGTATGAAAANEICRTLAAAAELDNAQTFRAWVSTPATDAFCRIAGFQGERATNCGQASLPNAGPWERTDGRPFSADLLSLLDESVLFHVANVDENGDPVPPSELFTGTSFDGTEQGLDCSAWSDSADTNSVEVGLSTNGGSSWTSAYISDCNQVNRLVCFEPGIGDPLSDFEQPGAYAFVTSANGSGNLGSWDEAGPATGIAAGDAICQNLAAAAGLPSPSTFLAWLSGGGVDAIDRLPAATAFKRLDGVRIAMNKSELTVATSFDPTLRAPLALDDTGEYIGGQALTGTTTTGVASGLDCNDWVSDSVSSTAAYGFPTDTRGAWTSSGAVDCDGFFRLYCFSTLVTIFRDGFEPGNASRWSNY